MDGEKGWVAGAPVLPAYTALVPGPTDRQAMPIHCVLWHAPDSPPTPQLTALLASRRVTIETCTDVFAAAARLCRAHRTGRIARRATAEDSENGSGEDSGERAGEPGKDSAATLVMLLVEPEGLADRRALARVVELHAPRTVCWVYQAKATPALRSVPLATLAAEPASSGNATADAERDAAPPPPVVTVAPTLRLARSEPERPTGDVPRREPAPPRPPAQVPINNGSVLTDEEMAMLLTGDDPRAAGPRKGVGAGQGRTSEPRDPRSRTP
ncbi:MAG: hypothetical protein R3B68_15860 [Phycisphaerales bacterium]